MKDERLGGYGKGIVVDAVQSIGRMELGRGTKVAAGILSLKCNEVGLFFVFFIYTILVRKCATTKEYLV